MKYLILESGIAYARALSAAMWGVTRPSGDNSTKYYVGTLQHPDGRAALQVLGEAIETEDEDGNPAYVFTESQPIHKDCDASAFREVIKDSVTEAEANAIEAGIEAAKGGRMSLLSVVLASPSLSPRLKTKEELQADGWFPEPQE